MQCQLWFVEGGIFSPKTKTCLSLVYVLLGIAYLLLFLWFGIPYVTSLQFGSVSPWSPSSAAYLLFYGFAFFLPLASFLCQLTAYGFHSNQEWARKLGIVISLPPAIGTLPSILFILEITSNWEYYDQMGVNPSFTVTIWTIVLIIGLVNSPLVYFLSKPETTKVDQDFSITH